MQKRLGAPHPSAAIVMICAWPLGCGAPRRIPAKSVNYFDGNMKDAEFSMSAELIEKTCEMNLWKQSDQTLFFQFPKKC
jgi:hypothetical protein